MRLHQVALSWLYRAIGVESLLNRVLHVPQEVLPTAAALAGVSPETWRSVESVQKQIVRQGIAIPPPVGEL